MTKAKFVSVACCQAEGIDFHFAYFDATQRLEELFGMQRVMECGSSVDAVQFEERGGDIRAHLPGSTRVKSDIEAAWRPFA